MNERPILFSGEMVRAILEGTKTQTRRPVPIPGEADYDGHNPYTFDVTASENYQSTGTIKVRNRYGKPGGRLWVRETWAAVPMHDATRPSEIDRWASEPIWYRANQESNLRGRWRPSIHMPREFSRIDLEITGVRVERLQDISVEDIIAEGLSTTLREHDACMHLREQWEAGWDLLNAKCPGCSWGENPWVWVIEFKRVQEAEAAK